MAKSARAQAPRLRRRSNDLAERILETALAMAEERSWRAVRLVDVAARLDIPAQEVLHHYRDLNSVADAWFLRGWEAMLAPKPDGFEDLPARERIEICMLAWFDRMAEHHDVTVQMLRGKLHPSHPHHWVPMVFDLSRTIHWLREAAALPATYGTRRADMEEVGLTALFLATLAVWSNDYSEGQECARRFLGRRLYAADCAMTTICGRRRAADHAA